MVNKAYQIFDGAAASPLTGELNIDGIWKNRSFWPMSGCVLEMVQNVNIFMQSVAYDALEPASVWQVLRSY